MHFANYHDQRERVARLDAGKCRAVYLRGDSEHGKSWLVEWFEKIYSGHARIVSVDLQPPQLIMSPILMMQMLVQELGPNSFRDFRHVLTSSRSGNVAKVENVRIYGDNNTVIAKNGVDPQDQLSIAIELTVPFLEDLRRIVVETERRVILCLDGYSPDSPVLGRWLETSFLGGVLKQKDLGVLVTGRSPLASALRKALGDCEVLELSGVHEVDEWLKLADALERHLGADTPELTRARVAGIIDYAKGHPADIMGWIERCPKRTGS